MGRHTAGRPIPPPSGTRQRPHRVTPSSAAAATAAMRFARRPRALARRRVPSPPPPVSNELWPALACATAAHAFQHASTRAWCVQKPGGVISRWASGSKLGSTMRYPRVTSLAASAEDVEETQMLAEEKMSKSLENLQGNLASLRTGRASPDILSRVTIDYYGAPTPLMQLASVSVTSSSQLLVDPYDKSAIADIERGIMDSNVGLTPNSDGEIIRLSVPQLTGDTRKTLAKEAKAIGEECKIAVRNIRRDAIETVKKFEKKRRLGRTCRRTARTLFRNLPTVLSRRLTRRSRQRRRIS